jgi:chemotaxis protein histidine kinase CheA
VDQIKSQVDQLAELGDDQVAELQSAIISEFDSFETQETTPETVDAMTSLADMLDTVRGELTRREVAAEELASRAAEAAMRVKGEVETMEGEEDAPEGEVVPTEEPVEAEPESDKEEDSEDKPDSEMEMGYGMDKEDKKKKDMKSYSSEEEVAVVADASVPESEAVSEPEETPEPETVTESEEASIVTEEVTEFSSETEEVVSDDAAVIETPEVVADASTEAEVVEEVSVEAELSATEAETTTTQDAQIEQEEQATVTASADEGFQAPADRQPVLQVSEPAKVAITAGADIPGYTAGSEIKGMYEVASAMEKRIHSLRRVNGGDGEQHIVASFTTSYPEERTLSTDAESNAAKIDAVVGREAIVASGGHAAPFEVKYDIFAQGSTTDRPVRDALPKFQADRGGIRFVTPPSFAAGTYADAVGIWTAANDSAQTPNPASKTSLTVAAAAEQTVSTDAVTLQLQFGNLMSRAYPELISRHNELALVQHAREAEDNLLAKIEAGSTAVSTSSLIGFGRDFLVQLRRAATAYRSRHRIAPDTVLKAIIPAWVYDAMAADLALAMPGDGTLAVSKGEIDGYLATINVDLVPTLDGTVFGAQGAAALVEFPDTFKWYLFSEGTFLFLDGGTLDLGIIRDSSLVGTNDYKMFIETFENVAKVGIESLAITSAISVNGVAAALRDTTGGATAAAIEL